MSGEKSGSGLLARIARAGALTIVLVVAALAFTGMSFAVPCGRVPAGLMHTSR